MKNTTILLSLLSLALSIVLKSVVFFIVGLILGVLFYLIKQYLEKKIKILTLDIIFGVIGAASLYIIASEISETLCNLDNFFRSNYKGVKGFLFWYSDLGEYEIIYFMIGLVLLFIISINWFYLRKKTNNYEKN